MSERVRCPIKCRCLCHDTGGFHGGMHGENGRCPTKDGLPLIDDFILEWSNDE